MSPSTTVSDLLARSQQAKDYYGRRLVERFVRLGSERYGLWWDLMLSADPADLDPDDSRFITETWRQFVDGEHPFRSRRVAS